MKPPFDPLKAGWVPCPVCENHESSFEGSTLSYRCSGCDGLGIVVAPPKDKCHVIPWRGTRIWDQAVRDAVESNKMREGFGDFPDESSMRLAH